MRVKTLQIVWHGNHKDPVFSVDFEPKGAGRFATAGGDGGVRIWRLAKDDNELPVVQFLADLNRHTEAANCVRWAPNGGILASASDDGTVMLWEQTEHTGAAFGEEDGASEAWRVAQILRGGTSAIYDIAWSPDSNFIVAACVDNTTRIFDVNAKKCIHALADHKHFVQGVAWDPLGKYFVSQSSDRSVNVYTCERKKGNFCPKLAARLTKLEPPTPVPRGENVPPETLPSQNSDQIPATSGEGKTLPKPRLFHDETLTSFFRRLTFSPDGSLLFAPAGIFRSNDDAEPKNAVHIYGRGRITGQPLACLPGNAKPSIAVRCSPIAYKLRNIPTRGPPLEKTQTSSTLSPPSLFRLPHRYVYAVACQDALTVYDTQQLEPIAFIGGLHYATLTDVAWSADGRTLLMTSTDGYSSVVSFEDGELGEPVEKITDTIVVAPPPLNPSPIQPGEVVIAAAAKAEALIPAKHTRDEPLPSRVLGVPVAPEVKKRRIAPTFIGKTL
ncbi:hypothetical protein HDU88_002613 [Geranomyces variabilis]|nr:hypothetical protein HDU88_002613 [Geranomyces variabilis]